MAKIITFYAGLWVTLYLFGFKLNWQWPDFGALFAKHFGESSAPGVNKDCKEGPGPNGYEFCIYNK